MPAKSEVESGCRTPELWEFLRFASRAANAMHRAVELYPPDHRRRHLIFNIVDGFCERGHESRFHLAVKEARRNAEPGLLVKLGELHEAVKRWLYHGLRISAADWDSDDDIIRVFDLIRSLFPLAEPNSKERASVAGLLEPRQPSGGVHDWKLPADAYRFANRIAGMDKLDRFWRRFVDREGVSIRRPLTKTGIEDPHRLEIDTESLYRAIHRAMPELEGVSTEVESRRAAARDRLRHEYIDEAVKQSLLEAD